MDTKRSFDMTGQTTNWESWSRFFAARRDRAAPALLNDDPFVLGLPASVTKSLAIFQLGESGGGTIVAQARDSRIREIDGHYADAMALFVAEEHRHAELLACCVRVLRGKLLQRNWTARLFVFARRAIGLRTKVAVLLAAEVVGLCYYQLLSRRLPDCEIRSTLVEILGDEQSHLDFHCAFLRTQVRTAWQRVLFMCAWRALMLAAGVVVLADHYRALRDLGIPVRELWRRWTIVSRRAQDLVTRDAPRRSPAVRRGQTGVAPVWSRATSMSLPSLRSLR